MLSRAELAAMPYGVEKQKFIRGNYILTANAVFDWYRDRADYIAARSVQLQSMNQGAGLDERDRAFFDEVDEYKQVMREIYPTIFMNENPDWYKMEDGDKIWRMVSEHCDVHIVAASKLMEAGWGVEQVAGLWESGGVCETPAIVNMGDWFETYTNILRESKDVLQSLGVDMAEAILAKNEQNAQHYPLPMTAESMLPRVVDKRVVADSIARRMREEIGPPGSQMPTLNMSPTGEGFLSYLHKSPFGTNGFSPKAIIVTNGVVERAQDDWNNGYNGLYSGVSGSVIEMLTHVY